MSNKAIKPALSKKAESGIIQADFRGKHNQSIEVFINSILRIESHYLKAQTRESIASDKSLADIYRDGKKFREEGVDYQ